eukprot:10432197-Alexandrium_andersonii.AAC.1
MDPLRLAYVHPLVRSAFALKGPYADLYATYQHRQLLVTGQFGPLDIFGEGSVPLFVSFCAKRSCWIQMPPSWFLSAVAAYIFRTAACVDDYINS